jgi:hypothetical protein
MFAQPVLRLKTRQYSPYSSAPVGQIDVPAPFRPRHLILQFNDPPTADTIAVLSSRGAVVLQGIPENALLVTINRSVSLEGLGVRYAAPFEASDKISPLIASKGLQTWNGYLLVEFHPDVDLNDARSLVLLLGIELDENPDLAPNQLLIHVGYNSARPLFPLERLAAQDETAYIFPASAALVAGTPTVAYFPPITITGPVAQYIPTYGPGWGGTGLNAATVTYVFSQITAQLPASSVESEIRRAMAQWTDVVQVTWAQGTNPTGNQTVNILFAAYAHGDGYPFDGPGGVLAHTFFPAPPNPEPIAGDMHFNDSESWHIGTDIDVFSVALHELGHSLGLGHSDNPADVMYPYYKIANTLAAGDVAAILTLYPAQGSTPVPAPAPTAPPTLTPAPTPTPTPTPTPASGGTDTTAPTLNITSPGGSTVSTGLATLTFSGTASDNVGVAKVTWSTNTGSSGTASGTTTWSAAIPLLVGSNQVTVRAFDAAGNMAWRSVVVSRN